MPDKKLTDSEIVKAMECKIKFKCPECPYFHSFPCDKCNTMLKDTLDLINRIQAENERLKEENNQLHKAFVNAECNYDDMRLKYIDKKVDVDRLLISNAEIKAEAYKEFAEELKKKIFFVNIHNCEKAEIKCIDLKPEHIDNLLKELVGEDNA